MHPRELVRNVPNCVTLVSCLTMLYLCAFTHTSVRSATVAMSRHFVLFFVVVSLSLMYVVQRHVTPFRVARST
jgi:hypothetical protein